MLFGCKLLPSWSFAYVEGNDAAPKAVIVSMRERVATLGISLATLAAKHEEVSAQLQAKQAEVDAERKKRLATEDQFARFRAAADRLLETVVGPDNEELKTLRAELSQLDDEKKVASSLVTGVTSLADDLEEHL